ncbi:MAG: hypothetical protein WC805_00025 [Patescibacteria group bacterium]
MDKTTHKKIFSSIVITLDDLKEVLRQVDLIVSEDNHNETYKKEPDFEVECNDGIKYESNTADNFIKQISLQLNNIKSVSLSYWGHDFKVRIWFYRFDSPVDFEIKASSEGKVLLFQKDITQVLQKSKSFNDLIYAWKYHFFYLVLMVALVDTYTLNVLSGFFSQEIIAGSISLKLSTIVNNLTPFIWLLFINLIPKFYPSLVIKNIKTKEASGRVLKDDIKWFIGGLLFVLLPLLF